MHNRNNLANLISLHGAFDVGVPQASSKTPLYIAGGILAAILITSGIAAVVVNRRRENEKKLVGRA